MEPAREPTPTPPHPDEPVLTREPLAPGRPPGSAMRRWFNLFSLLVLVVLGFAGLQALRSHFPLARVAPTPTPTLRPIPTPPTPAPTLPPGQGWVPAGPVWAQQIAFAPSAPSRGYVCGVPTPTSQRGRIALGVSDDSGTSWHILTTPASGTACGLTINPINPLDVVLQATPCFNCQTPPPATLIRSLDGGQSWSQARFPPRPDQPTSGFIGYNWAWVGGTLFITPYAGQSAPNRLLAISANGAPFTWVLAPSLFTSVPPDSQLVVLYGTESAVYADLERTQPCVSGECDVVMVSHDQGETWILFTPTFQGRPVLLFETALDGRMLIGTLSTGQDGSTPRYVRSLDGGATWTPLVPAPGDLVIFGLVSAPDGTLYAEMWFFGIPTATPGIYVLAPDAPAWKLLGALPASGQPPVLAWDALRGPLALWSVGGDATEQGPARGLVKFAL